MSRYEFDDTPYDFSEIESWGVIWKLNNFHMLFPRSSRKSYWEELVRGLGRMDERPDLESPGADTGVSSYRASKTNREFLQEVGLTVMELGIEGGLIEEVIKQMFEHSSREARQKCMDVLLPVYIRLRERGYSRNDLFL